MRSQRLSAHSFSAKLRAGFFLAATATIVLPSALISKEGPGGARATYGDGPARMELQMLDAVNRDRLAPSNAAETRWRARPLQWNDRLAAVARSHSEEMAESGFFSHLGDGGTRPWTRISKAGIAWRVAGENIYMGRDVLQGETAFMDEPHFEDNHRGNILNPNYTQVGIGIVRGADGMLYATQDFIQAP